MPNNYNNFVLLTTPKAKDLYVLQCVAEAVSGPLGEKGRAEVPELHSSTLQMQERGHKEPEVTGCKNRQSHKRTQKMLFCTLLKLYSQSFCASGDCFKAFPQGVVPLVSWALLRAEIEDA